LRTNVLSVPIASVTARLPVENKPALDPPSTNATAARTNSLATNSLAATNSTAGTNIAKTDKKLKDAPKQVDCVFVVDGDHVKMIPVKIGISDDNYWEVTDGLKEGQEVVSGGYHAISHDLEDGKKIVKGKAMPADTEKKAM